MLVHDASSQSDRVVCVVGAPGTGKTTALRDLAERRALEQLRAGDAATYLAHAVRRRRLHLDDDATLAKQRLLEDWWEAAQHDLSGTVMLVHRRADVSDLNEAARTLLALAGRLGPDALEAGSREFRVGDRVVCRRN